ncbi:MAG TPA: acyl-ACP desaturase, partial [Pseudonocardiaceae bacterium]|nr:acyl-ACP desaturase [Pseudonocardiaceae bacterium]
EGEQARTELAEFVADLDTQATRFEERRAQAEARAAAKQ